MRGDWRGVPSRYIDRSDVNTAIYLSDGAGAAVLSRSDDPKDGIISSAFHTDSSNYESVRMRGGGSSHPLIGRAFDPAVDYMEMNGIATWKQAITHLPRDPQGVRRAEGAGGCGLHAVSSGEPAHDRVHRAQDGL
jgi:3-oxoacyl-[acyl-carrier-protein] synthase III